MVSARDVLYNPRSKVAKKDLFQALLSPDEAEDALADGGDPETSISLSRFSCYRGDSKVLNKVQRIASRLSYFQTQERLIADLQALGKPCADDLSDPTRYFHLRLASIEISRQSPPPKFLYVGRPEFKRLLQAVQAEGAETSIDFSGPPGRGKSFIMAALAQHLIVNDPSLSIVYVVGQPYSLDSFRYLLSSLLLAHWRDPGKQSEILGLESMEELTRWCRQRKGLVFLVDEADCFDNEKETAPTSRAQRESSRTDLYLAASQSSVVWCASVQSTWAAYKGKGREELVTLERPFNHLELRTWLTAMEDSKKLKAGGYSFRELVYFTGYIPRLLDSFARHGHEITTGILAKIFKELNHKLKDFSSQDMNMLEQLLSGGLVPRETVDLDPAFFFVDKDSDSGATSYECRVWCLCPYLEMKLRERLRYIKVEESRSSLLNRIEDSSAVILRDAQCANPARMGWLVGGLVIDCLEVVGKLDDVTFKHNSTYAQGQEKQALAGTKLSTLEAGVLFLSLEFNAPAIDAVVVKLGAAGNLVILGIQISVTPWERKEEKNSHQVWLDRLSRNWTLTSRPVLQIQRRFIYILSDAVRAAKAVAAAQEVKVMKFSDVHHKLAFIDEINLPDQCRGFTGNKQRSSQGTDYYYCHPASKKMKSR